MALDPTAFADMVALTFKAMAAPLLERIAGLEARLAQAATVGPAVDALRERVVVVETKAAAPAPVAEPVDPEILTTLRERVAALESRAPVPGPAGKDGAPGLDGKDGAPGLTGKDGKDGTPGLDWVGVYQAGKSYERSQCVTAGGSTWHCNEPTTTAPGDGAKAWSLMVKRGRDGKDGRDGTPPPVVSLGGR